MKIFFALFVVAAVLLAVYPFLQQSDDEVQLTGLPWQIEVLPDGSTRVFGLQIGVSRLGDAVEVLGEDMEFAIVAASDETGSLEMYYGHYRTGLLSGKMILHASASEQDIRQWRDSAVKSEYMATGKAKKYYLPKQVLSQALGEVITGITFVPAINLDEDVIRARFGEPEKVVEVDGTTHYLYPEKGLDIALHKESKEVLQYVSPGAFQQLTVPLE